MAEEDVTRAGADAGEATGGEPPQERSTPFDHPAFLPSLLILGTAWFAYDGWLNQDESMQEHIHFNRFGAAILFGCAVFFTIDTFRRIPFLGTGILALGAIWMAWLGWLSDEGGLFALEADMRPWMRGGAGGFVLVTIYAGIRGILEWRKRRRPKGTLPPG